MPSYTTPSLRSRLKWKYYNLPRYKQFLVIFIPLLTIFTIWAAVIVCARIIRVTTVTNEVRAMLELGASGTEEEFYERCKSIKSKDPKMSVVERGAKNYLCSLTRDTNELLAEFDEGGMIATLETDSLSSDDENLSNGREKVAHAKALVEQKRSELWKYFSYEGAVEFLEGEADEEIINMFISLTIDEQDMDGAEAIYRSLINMLENMADVYTEALDYLTTNRGDWSIDGTIVSFEDENKLAEYWAILDRADEIAKNYSEKYLITDEDIANQAVTENDADEGDLSNFVLPVFH